MAKRIITESEILEAAARGEKRLAANSLEAILTPQALDTAKKLGIAIDGEHSNTHQKSESISPGTSPTSAGPTTGSPGRATASELAGQIAQALRGKIPNGVDSAEVERLVREAVAARIAGSEPKDSAKAVSCASDCGVVFVDSTRLLTENTSTAGIKEKVVLAHALGRAGESKLSAGYLVWEKSTVERVVEASEVCIVIEGELRLTVGGETLIGKPGDMIYLPQGVKVTYSTSSRVMLACVGHQA